jgi:hypothetical protein
MTLASRTIGLFLFALVGGSGCESTKAGPTHGWKVSGSVDPTVQAEGLTATLVWEVSSGTTDYGYKYGEATISNGRFSIALPNDPPAEAINSFGIGIAVVMVLGPGVTLPDGKIAASVFSSADIVGISARYSVIWRAKTLDLPESGVPANFWPLQFPQGLACGACTPAPDGGGFDGFTPTACDQLQIAVFDTANVCNWT